MVLEFECQGATQSGIGQALEKTLSEGGATHNPPFDTISSVLLKLHKKSAPAGTLQFLDFRACLIRRRWSEIHRAGLLLVLPRCTANAFPLPCSAMAAFMASSPS